MKRNFNILTAASSAACVIGLIVSLATINLGWEKYSITVAQNIHIAFFNAGVWFYNGSFPYKGEMWMIGNPGSGWPKETRSGWKIRDYGFSKEVYVHKNGEIKKRNACDLPGIYYRRFEHSRFPGTDSTLRISIWCPFLIFSILPSIWLFKRRKHLAKILSWRIS
ncbi:MAG: hypothetical protein ABIP71_13080 [Verrucomicrobiota bacterium]